MPDNDLELEIIELWPSSLLNQAIPGHEPHTTRLVELALAHPDEAVFSIEDPSLDWLKAQIGHGVGACLLKAGFVSEIQWGAIGSFDVQHLDDYRSLRNHPGAYFTGIYVARSNTDDEGIGIRNDRRSGCITFYDPRMGVNMNAINKDPYISYNQTVTLLPGNLLIWPAYVSYFLHPNLAREPAVRVAFDIQVDSSTKSE